MCRAFVRLRVVECAAALHGAPVRNGDRLDRAEATQSAGEAETKVGDFEDRVVTIPEQARVEFHDRSPPEVVLAVFGVLHELAQVFRSLANLRGVLSEVLEH